MQSCLDEGRRDAATRSRAPRSTDRATPRLGSGDGGSAGLYSRGDDLVGGAAPNGGVGARARSAASSRFMKTDYLFTNPNAVHRIPSWRERQVCACGMNRRSRTARSTASSVSRCSSTCATIGAASARWRGVFARADRFFSPRRFIFDKATTVASASLGAGGEIVQTWHR